MVILSYKEETAVRMIAQGKTNREIGIFLNRTEEGTKNFMRKLYDKLGMDNRLEVSMWAVKHLNL